MNNCEETKMKAYLEAGKITNTHGIRGDIKVEVWCDDYETFEALPALYLENNGEYTAYKITKNSPYKGQALVHLKGIDIIEEAEKLKGRTVYAARADLNIPEDRVFIADILGLPVIDANTEENYGILRDVIDGGAGQLYEVKCPDGTIAYMPAISQFIDRIEDEVAVFVTPPAGLF
jgi:16S rRNA processing protein RimM